MKFLPFASRNSKEMMRDPLNLAFGLGFPIVLLLLLSAINANIPKEVQNTMFAIDNLTPGIAAFGLTFITLFSATLISKDRSSSFLMRLFASPLSSTDFILGYVLPLLPMAIIQVAICFICALILGLTFSIHILTAIIVLIPTAVLYIGIGLLAGSVFTDKQVGGICGALLTNVSAWLSGAWFDLKLVGGAFEKIAYLLPFAHSVDSAKAALAGDYSQIFPHLWWVIGYAAIIMVIAITVFKKKMNSDKV